MKFRTRSVLALAAAGAAVCAGAAALAAPTLEENIDSGGLDEAGRSDVERVGGLVVDRTVTNFGATFYRYFCEAWREEEGTNGLDVAVTEKPSARFGSTVVVEHNRRPIAQVSLGAGRPATIRPSAEAAARYAASRLRDDALAAALMTDPDLAKEELK